MSKTKKTMEEPKYTYFRIDFNNCSMPYDYTICPEHEIQDQMIDALTAFDGWEDVHEEKPTITISPVIMSHEEYAKWFMDNVEANA